MSNKTKFAIAIAVFLWSSAYVAIRAGLHHYSPEGLALFRYLIASFCMALIYFRSNIRKRMSTKDAIGLLSVGAFGIGVYNITLNYGELSISSGMACFIISQSPIVTASIAIFFLGEKISLVRALGFLVSIAGIVLITEGERSGFKWNVGLYYILIATIAGGSFSLLQKPFIKKYHVIETTTFVIWGGTLFLLLFSSHLLHDIRHAPLSATAIVIYLGVFPAAIAYLCWSYVLREISAAHAMSFLYSAPFIATLLGWLCLGETPLLLSLVGGLLAIAGVWLINNSYKINVHKFSWL